MDTSSQRLTAAFHGCGSGRGLRSRAAGRLLLVRSGRFATPAGNACIHAIAMVRLRAPRHDPLAKRRRFIWLVLARGLHEQGDLDAVVDVELVEQAGDVGLTVGTERCSAAAISALVSPRPTARATS